MLVIHAAFQGDHLFLWAESSLDAKVTGKGSPQRKKTLAQESKPLPYDPGIKALSAGLSGLDLPPDRTRLTPEVRSLWLPAINGQPLPSSPLIADGPDTGGTLELRPWTITIIPLNTDQWTSWLSQCAGKELLGPGVISGRDLSFWTAALRFAGALVTRQAFLPSLEEENGLFRAYWQPVLSGPDLEQLHKLVAAMPASCRAVSDSNSAPPILPAATVLNRFILLTVDGLVRSSGALPAGFPRPSPGRAGQKIHSLHGRWLSALTSRDGSLEGKGDELRELARQIEEWQYPVQRSTDTPFRLTFRLEEPEEELKPRPARKAKPPDWQLRYLLQGVKDPSLLLPAGAGWTDSKAGALLGKNIRFNAREYLLLSLGQAAKIYPPLEAGLKTSAPESVPMTTGEAFEFLREKAWVLKQAGFGIIVPSWWTGRGTRLHLSAKAKVRSPKMKGSSGFLDQALDFNWELALGGEPITLQELEELARLKTPLVKYRGQWVQLGPDELQAALELWKKKGQDQATIREVIQMSLGARPGLGPVPLEGVQADGWVADLIGQLEGRTPFSEIPAPAGFQGRLRPYQTKGTSWLSFLGKWGLGACLADDMGLGKTIQTLALLQRRWELNGKKPSLLICPMSVVSNWEKEAARFTPDLPVMIHHGLGRAKDRTFKKAVRGQALVVSSYALLHRDFEILKEVAWSGLILDEAQNIKNPETKQARAARSIPAEYRIALTGTPVENHVGDLWSIMEFLNPGFLGRAHEFKRNFFIPIQAGQDPEALERLKRLTGPFILRRLKTDKAIIKDLPRKLEMKVFCPLTREQAGLYTAVVRESLKLIETSEGIGRRGAVLASLIKLKQVCNHPAQFLKDNSPIPGRSGKVARLTEMTEEILANREAALIFTQFTEMGTLLKKHLQETFGREVLFLHGALPKKERDRLIELFQDGQERGALFILSLKAGGTGLNLTRANHVFHFDRWWNPAVENQATDRAFRIGQTKNVQVHKFICAGTLEEKIDQLIEAKQELAGKLVASGEAWLTEFSTKELKELFALRQEAIGD
ncbi:MAG: DEAD/DEAH box helicase [Deltaproteobacteria bacterium]|nr:DEAD/DEAH box helicase [Deltaproteobacteria bacterium]